MLIASADGFQPQASTVVVGEEPLAFDILLSGTSGLAGAVRAEATGEPVEGAMVVVTDVRGDVLATGASGASGEFAFGELIPGSVTVAVTAASARWRCRWRSAARASPASRRRCGPVRWSGASCGPGPPGTR